LRFFARALLEQNQSFNAKREIARFDKARFDNDLKRKKIYRLEKQRKNRSKHK
jgi:hypothetical protein